MTFLIFKNHVNITIEIIINQIDYSYSVIDGIYD
jgi:hypothetical protein